MLDQKQQSNSFEERVETIKQGGDQSIMNKIKQKENYLFESFSASI
ncbi:hypothetical protein [Bacillus cereus]